jgi:hypothetical protein
LTVPGATGRLAQELREETESEKKKISFHFVISFSYGQDYSQAVRGMFVRGIRKIRIIPLTIIPLTNLLENE